MVTRCAWAEADDLLKDYHDKEWGQRVEGDQALFELLTLEMFQTGLSWRTILHKREGFREAFSNFNLKKVSAYDEAKVEELVQNPSIIRHRGKINAAIHNAKASIQLIKENGSLESFILSLPESMKEKEKVMKRTFKHVGPSVVESFLIAGGFIETPHDPECFLYHPLSDES